MIAQTQNAIEALRACGLKRNEFSVRTPRIMRGRTFVGYGEADIRLHCDLDKMQQIAPELAKHFQVVQYKGYRVIHVYTTGKPGLVIKDLD